MNKCTCGNQATIRLALAGKWDKPIILCWACYEMAVKDVGAQLRSGRKGGGVK